jgi:uncharacterized protein
MSNNFIPDIYAASLFTINYAKLKERGIKCLLIDLDNTIAPIFVREPSKEIKDLFRNLDDMGFKVIIMSNSGKARITPFKEELNVDSAYFSTKPLRRKYQRIMKIYKYDESEIAAIGDQIMTDVWGANRMGLTSIFVDKLGEPDFIFTKFNRFWERIILHNLKKKGIYEVGHYYD